MNQRFIILSAGLVLLASASPVAADDSTGGRTLDAGGKQVQRLEVSSSFGGFRDTLVFYTFKDQKAVLKVVIDNKDKKFPVAATIYAFADGVTEEGLKKWLNNQHSDGLFVDVPEPVAIHKIPPGSCKTLSRKFLDHSKQPFGEFDNYTVGFQLSGVPQRGKYVVKDFRDKAVVHSKTN